MNKKLNLQNLRENLPFLREILYKNSCFLPFALCLLLFGACNYVYDKTIDIPVSTENKLVLQADFLSDQPNGNIVFVTKINAVGQYIQFDSAKSNAPFTSFNADSVLGARVFLFKDDVLVTEIYHQARDANGIFTTKGLQPFVQNAVYKIRVTAPGFTTVEATQTVPSYVPLKNAKLNFGGITTNGGVPLSEIQFNFDDPVNEDNYYAIVGTTCNPFCSQTFDASFVLIDKTAITEKLMSDQLFNGKNFTWRVGTLEGEILGVQRISLTLTFSTVNKAFVDYSKSTTNVIKAAGSPYVEPFTPITNVTNGYGFFNLRGKASTVSFPLG